MYHCHLSTLSSNDNSNVYELVSTIQRLWRGYQGRRMFMKAQLQKERGKLKSRQRGKLKNGSAISQNSSRDSLYDRGSGSSTLCKDKDNTIQSHDSSTSIGKSTDDMAMNDDVIICKVVKKDSRLGSYNGAASSALHHARMTATDDRALERSNVTDPGSVSIYHTNSQSIASSNTSHSVMAPILSVPFITSSKPSIILSYVAGPLSAIEEVDDSMIRDSLQSTMNSKSSTIRSNLSTTHHLSSPSKVSVSSSSVIKGMPDLLRSHTQMIAITDDSMVDDTLVDSLDGGSSILKSLTTDIKRSSDPHSSEDDDVLQDSLTLSNNNYDDRRGDKVMGQEDRRSSSSSSRRIEKSNYNDSGLKYHNNHRITDPSSSSSSSSSAEQPTIVPNNRSIIPPRSPTIKYTTASAININKFDGPRQQPSIPTKHDLLSSSPIRRRMIDDVSSPSASIDDAAPRSPIKSQLMVVQELYEANIRSRFPIAQQPPAQQQQQRQQPMQRHQNQHHQQQLQQHHQQHHSQQQQQQQQQHRNAPPQPQAMNVPTHLHQQQRIQQPSTQPQQQRQIQSGHPQMMQCNQPTELLLRQQSDNISSYESNFDNNNRKKAVGGNQKNSDTIEDSSEKYNILRDHHQVPQQGKNLNYENRVTQVAPLQPNKMIVLNSVVQHNDSHPRKTGSTSSKDIAPAKNIHRIIPGINRATIQDLQEKKLLDEIEELNRIQLQRLKELSVIEKQEQQSMSKQQQTSTNDKRVVEGKSKHSHNDVMDRVIDSNNGRKRDIIVNQANVVPVDAQIKVPLKEKEKEKKAFGPGARDYKQPKPLDQQQLQVEKQGKIVPQQAGKKQKDAGRIESNNNNLGEMIDREDSTVREEKVSLLNQWSQAISNNKEKPTRGNSNMLINGDDAMAVDNVGGGIGGGYLVEFNKRRAGQRQRSASSNPRGRILRVDPSSADPQQQQYVDDSSTVRSDSRLLSQRQREQYHQQKQQLQMEETISLPTILPNRHLKSSQHAFESSESSSQGGIFSIKSDKGQGTSNRNTTMSAPPKMMELSSVVPLVLPSITNKKSLLNHEGNGQARAPSLLVHPSRHVDRIGGDGVVYPRSKRG
jgi:hypothetical protein